MVGISECQLFAATYLPEEVPIPGGVCIGAYFPSPSRKVFQQQNEVLEGLISEL